MMRTRILRLHWLIVSVVGISIAIASPAVTASHRIADIQTRDTLNCGIWPQVRGFAFKQEGAYAGFEVDMCRAVAAAILGDASKVTFVTLAHLDQFIQHNDIDVAIRRLTRTVQREARTGMTFGPVIFHDGQGFLVPTGSGITSLTALRGDSICVINRERHPQILFDFLSKSGRQDTQMLLVETDKEAERALQEGRCSAYSADVSWLAAARAGFAEGLSRYELLSELISEEPLAPLMRTEDTQLIQIVRLTVLVMLEAEELGITSGNIDSLSEDSESEREFRTVQSAAGNAPSSLPALWVRTILSGVGNYAEVYERNLGARSQIALDRGPNRLYSQGGLMHAPPVTLE